VKTVVFGPGPCHLDSEDGHALCVIGPNEIRIRVKPTQRYSRQRSRVLGSVADQPMAPMEMAAPADIVFGVLAFILSAIVIASPGVAVTNTSYFSLLCPVRSRSCSVDYGWSRQR